MEINIDLTRDDYADYNKYYFLKKGLRKRIYIVIIVAFGLPLVINSGRPFDLMTYLTTVIIAGLVFGLIYLGGMTFAMKRTKKLPSDNGSILGRKKFMINDEGLIEESENNKNIQKWKGIKSVETNDNSVFIFVDNIAAYIIPKRFFKDDTEQQNFIKTIEDKMKNAT
jgi:hypothetical protein